MNIADKVKKEFEDAIRAAIEDWERDYGEQTTLFSRKRKLDKVTMIKLLCLMGGQQSQQRAPRLSQSDRFGIQLLRAPRRHQFRVALLCSTSLL